MPNGFLFQTAPGLLPAYQDNSLQQWHMKVTMQVQLSLKAHRLSFPNAIVGNVQPFYRKFISLKAVIVAFCTCKSLFLFTQKNNLPDQKSIQEASCHTYSQFSFISKRLVVPTTALSI